ncbi:MAG: MFS transporter [Alphaproteobacteria bacterium]|nr:MFS transporter [Alphaproteobacteria bacterium]
MDRVTQRWLLVGVAFAALSLSGSARSALGLVMPVWEAEFGISRSLVSFGGAVTLLVMAVVAPFAGAMVDRMGPRPLLMGGLALVASGMALTAAAPSPWVLLLGFSLVGAVGFGAVANHVIATVVSLRFVERPGLPVGIATAGSTAGQLLLVPMLALVLGGMGWRAAFAILAAGALALALFVPRLVPAGGRGGAWVKPAPLGHRLVMLAKSPVFLAMFVSFFICGVTTAGVIEVHLMPYAAACGFPPQASALAYGVLSAFNMVGMVAAGWLSDRVNRPPLLGTIYIVRGLSFLILMNIAGDLPLLFLFAVIFGLFDYATVPVMASIVRTHIGRDVMGLTMGVLSAGHSLGAAIAAFAAGRLFDLFARYDWTWGVSLGLAIAAGLLVFTIREDADPAPANLSTERPS